MDRRIDPPDPETPAQELEARFFDLSVDMLCILGFDGRFKRLNSAWEKTLGFTRDELMSGRFIDFVHPEDRERTLQQNGRVRDGGQTWLFENRYLCKDGSHRWLLWTSVSDAGREVIYGVARDVTERKQAEQEREALIEHLQAAIAEVRTLQGYLPICSYCKRVRDDENYWHAVEAYISRHTDAQFSHGICPSCYATVVKPELDDLEGR